LEAQIGATVKIDGVEVPYRPVNLEWMRGPQGHEHAWHHSWALTLVNIVVGALGVVGSGHSTEVAHNWPIKSWPEAGEDGMLQNRGSAGRGTVSLGAFPGRTVTRPGRWDLFEMFPVALHSRTLVPEVFKEPGKYGIDHNIELLIHTSGNYVMGGWGDTNAVVDWYKSIDLVVGFAVEIHETHEMDDIVLPMPTYLEENTFRGSPGNPARIAIAGDHVGFHHIQQAVIKPPEGVRSPVEVMMEIYERVGVLDDVYRVINRSVGLKPPYLLEAGKRYTEAEVLDRDAKSLYGEDKGWDWFKENGVLVHLRDVDERYPGRFIKARIPI
jgi:anaerobic selenocysteine-containing dehydrogenase